MAAEGASLEALDEFLAALTAAKNRWFSQGGFSPVQMVFDPGDAGGLSTLADAYHDPAGLDEHGAELEAIKKAASAAPVPVPSYSSMGWPRPHCPQHSQRDLGGHEDSSLAMLSRAAEVCLS